MGGDEVYPELNKLMAYKGLKHKDIAKVLGISQQAMSKKIKGETEFKYSDMQKIKAFFQKDYPEITLEQIFTKDIFLV
jgi:predicted transcriptional regulator